MTRGIFLVLSFARPIVIDYLPHISSPFESIGITDMIHYLLLFICRLLVSSRAYFDILRRGIRADHLPHRRGIRADHPHPHTSRATSDLSLFPSASAGTASQQKCAIESLCTLRLSIGGAYFPSSPVPLQNVSAEASLVSLPFEAFLDSLRAPHTILSSGLISASQYVLQ